MQHSGLAAVDFFNAVDDNYVMEEDGLSGGDAQVNVPSVSFQLTEEHQEELKQAIAALGQRDDFGIDESNNCPFYIYRLYCKK